MKQRVLGLYEGFFKAKAAIVLAVLLLYAALTVYSGGSVAELLLFGCVMAVYIALPGLFMADVLGTERFAPGLRGPLAVLLGTGFFAVLYCFAMRLHILWLLWVLPPLLALGFVALWAVKKRKGKDRRPPTTKTRFALPPAVWMLVLLFAALLLLYTFAGVIKYGRPTAVGDVLLNHDMLWNTGNANSFKLAFPPQDIRFVNVRLHYHYLTELVSGALSLVSGISAYNIIGFYLQPYALAALLLCLFRLGRVLWPQSLFKALLFPYSLFLFSCASLWKVLPNGLSVFWNSNITHLITNINSQTTAFIFLSIFCALFVLAARKVYRIGLLHGALLVCAFVLLTFSKGPLAALVVIGLALALVVGLFQKKTGWRGLLLGVVVVGLFVFIYTAMFSSGANSSMPFSPAGTLRNSYFGNILERFYQTNYTLYCAAIPALWVVQSVLMVPAAFPLYLRSVFGDIKRFAKLSPQRLLFNAVAVGGLAAYFLFDHPSMSQTYFLFGAIFFMHILAIDKIDTLRWPPKGENGQKRRGLQKVFVAVSAFCIAVGFATTCFLYTNLMGSGARQLARNLGFIEKYPYETVVTPDDELAMLWLRDNSPKDAVFATNRIHTGGRREGISNLYSAFCERQGYMEGFQYAVTNMGVPQDEVHRRLAVNTALFSADTPPDQVVAFCWENGIDYLIFSAQMDGQDTQLAGFERVYDSESVRVYKVPEY